MKVQGIFAIACSIVWYVASFALAEAAKLPIIKAQINLDTATGDITITTNQEALPIADWLEIKGAISHGKLPPITSLPASSGWTREASYITGNSWLGLRDDTHYRHDITVNVPAENRVAVTGRILEDRIDGNDRQVKFRFDGPSASLGIFVGLYNLNETSHDDLTLRTYFDPSQFQLSDTYLAASAIFIDQFEAQIGSYPYDSFSVVSAPIPVGLGFAGLTYVGRSILSHSYMSGRSLAHEILHSWWGNSVLVDYDQGNWAEGLTTFMSDYSLAESESPEAARLMRMDWIRQLDVLGKTQMRPLTQFRSSNHNGGIQAEGYGKVALIFNMLRAEIGDNAFENGLRDFYKNNKDKTASWSDVQVAFEGSASRGLQNFFEQWITRAGLPQIHLERAIQVGENNVSLTLRQSEPAYNLLIPVLIETIAGPEQHYIRLSENLQTIILSMHARPLSVQIDPDFNIARHPVTHELSPTLANAFAMKGFNAILANPDALEAMQAKAVAQKIIDHDLDWNAMTSRYQANLVFGTTEQMNAYYRTSTGSDFPHARSGTARAWVEASQDGRLTLYLSADNMKQAVTQMQYLRYYGSKSYVSFVNGNGHTHGVLPGQGSALKITLNE